MRVTSPGVAGGPYSWARSEAQPQLARVGAAEDHQAGAAEADDVLAVGGGGGASAKKRELRVMRTTASEAVRSFIRNARR